MGFKLEPLIPVPYGKKGTLLNKWSTLKPEELAVEAEKVNGKQSNWALRLDNYASLDPDSPEAIKLLDDWETEGIIPPTVAWRTASGAVRRLFKAPLGARRIVIEGINLDLRHGTGFCDIIPPSFVVDSKKGLRGNYEWIKNQSPEDMEPAELPIAVLEYFINRDSSKSIYNTRDCKRNANSEYVLWWQGVSEGEPGRDMIGTRLAGRLLSRGMPQDEVVEILAGWNYRNSPPLPEKDIEKIVKSIEKKDLKKLCDEDRKIAEEVRDWVLTTNGIFTTTLTYAELSLTTKDHKKAAIMALLRLRDEGVIVECGTKRGCYRTVEHESPEIDWLEADIRRVYDLKWPFGLEELVNIYPKNIIIIAGASNAGKTAFLLNFVKMNLEKCRIKFLSSEMGPEELKLRITKFPDFNKTFWRKFKPRERASNFADAISPNSVNIIDYFEISDNFYAIGGELRAIHDKLKDGIAIIAIQKKGTADLGRGAEFSLEKPRLYLTMNPGELKIVKGKNWAQPGRNPNGMVFKFKLINGAEFLEYGGKNEYEIY